MSRWVHGHRARGGSIVGVELVKTLRASVEDRRAFISTTSLGLTELHLGVVTLWTFLIRGLLCTGNFLRDWKSGESIALPL
jgi:hypothetical protein